MVRGTDRSVMPLVPNLSLLESVLPNDQRPTGNDSDVPEEARLASDELFMEAALRAAQRALEAGEVPVGAVVVCQGEIIAEGWNRNLTGNDPTAHAEIVALRAAGAIMGNQRLGDCELFATIEPCAMCAGALVHSRIKRLVYGADDPKAGAVHSAMHVLNHLKLNHRMDVVGGTLAGRCAEVLQAFFRERRQSSQLNLARDLSVDESDIRNKKR